MVDENGNYFGLRKTNAQNNGSTMYNFLFNAQGDVIGLVDNMGNFQASYTYDAWGKVLSVKDKNGNEITDPNHIANVNPIRYRGYYYDRETGLYYLQTRYYDPETGRFINADDTDIAFADLDKNLLAVNLFAYCWNNPVNLVDHDGESPANVVGAFIGGAVGAAAGILIANALGLKGWKKWALIAACTVAGAVLGAVIGPYVAKLSSAALAKLGSAATAASTQAQKAWGGLSRAAQWGIQSYSQLTKAIKGLGLQAHHIIEKRFGLSNISVALTKSEHKAFTNHWRQLLPYGKSYTVNQVWAAAQKVYAKYPELLAAAKKALGK